MSSSRVLRFMQSHRVGRNILVIFGSGSMVGSIYGGFDAAREYDYRIGMDKSYGKMYSRNEDIMTGAIWGFAVGLWWPITVPALCAGKYFNRVTKD
jgi:hypothetical protein